RIVEIEKAREAVIGGIERDEEIDIARLGVEILSPRRRAEQVEPRDAEFRQRSRRAARFSSTIECTEGFLSGSLRVKNPDQAVHVIASAAKQSQENVDALRLLDCFVAAVLEMTK
ncbi:MAG: hypothetical protein JO312_08090, partial [Hyphomicrobiales bacterium]|nr:hypothetical protein [Hyphomicrobiales bacterium]